jgi:hypothetical protein
MTRAPDLPGRATSRAGFCAGYANKAAEGVRPTVQQQQQNPNPLRALENPASEERPAGLAEPGLPHAGRALADRFGPRDGRKRNLDRCTPESGRSAEIGGCLKCAKEETL